MDFWPDGVIEETRTTEGFRRNDSIRSWMLARAAGITPAASKLFILRLGRWIRLRSRMKFIDVMSVKARRRSPLHAPPARFGIAMTLPFRMVQASATAVAEQLCAAPIRATVDRAQASAWADRAGIGHDRYAVPLAPWQQVMLGCRDYRRVVGT